MRYTRTHTIQLGRDTLEVDYGTDKRGKVHLSERAYLHFDGMPSASGGIDLEDIVPCPWTINEIIDQIKGLPYE